MMITPDEFMGKTIKMSGTFASYEENGNTYYTLEDAVLTQSTGNPGINQGLSIAGQPS